MLQLKQLLILLPLLQYAAALPTFGTERGLEYTEAGTGAGLGSLDPSALAIEAQQDEADGLDKEEIDDFAALYKRTGGAGKKTGQQGATASLESSSSSSKESARLLDSSTASLTASASKKKTAVSPPLQRVPTAKPNIHKPLPMLPPPESQTALSPMEGTTQTNPIISKPPNDLSKKPLPPTPFPGAEGDAPPPPAKNQPPPNQRPQRPQKPQRPKRPTDPDLLPPVPQPHGS
ncbi:hypothetical protein PspLS_03755 [Pyricularia sp. CBS 133598]|nr:hypothetical protein PspLS_03755 [Pyricularia sp. CBS 133598]